MRVQVILLGFSYTQLHPNRIFLALDEHNCIWVTFVEKQVQIDEVFAGDGQLNFVWALQFIYLFFVLLKFIFSHDCGLLAYDHLSSILLLFLSLAFFALGGTATAITRRN